MRSRSHRLPMTEPRQDDWVDESWTVDCVCGVTFDDGEEMVNCDECGVWVHTRCSRYVKGEKSFACDKCKSKSSGVRIESEETEVAEFLVELPTKTLMDNPNPATVASRKPLRLWTDIPMEERVHVQGMPGGEPALFPAIGMSSVFGPQLWKSTGYVPKKFNLRYTEFPFSGQGKIEAQEEEEMVKTNGEKNSVRADNGARVLVSLLNKNESSLPTPIVDSARVKVVAEGRTCREIVAPRQKKLEGKKSYFVPEEGSKKRNSVTVVLKSGKRKKEDIGASKDQNLRKKVRVIEKEGDVRMRAVHDPKSAASTFSSDAKHLESSPDSGCKACSNDQCGKDPGHQPLDRLGKCATNLASNEHGLESTSRNDVSRGETLKAENKGAQVLVESENLSNSCNVMESLPEVHCLQSLPVTEEVTGDTLQRSLAGTGSVGIDSCEKEPAAVDFRTTGRDAKENGHGNDSDIDEANSRPIKKLKTELNSDDHGDHIIESLHLNDVKLDVLEASPQYPVLSVNVVTGEGKVFGTADINAEADEAKVLDANRSLIVGCPRTDKPDESTANTHHSKREHSGPEGLMGARKKSSGLKPGSEVADELLKSNGTTRSHATASYQRKAGISVLRSTSTSGIMSKSSENCTAGTAQNSSVCIKRELSDSSHGTIKDKTSADKAERVEKCGRPKKLVKESSRSGTLTKVSETNKLSDTSDSKMPPSDSRDPGVQSSSKVPLSSNVASTNVSGESACLPSTESASTMQNKASTSAIPGKGEKPYHSGSNPSSRGHVASMTSPASSNIPATLSDEELALLLHQELNSSPRVPRVPRMRHAGSLPQLTGPSSTSTLMKRTSSGGGKDHGMASRRRTKDLSGEGLQVYPELENEAKKMDRKPNSPDNRRPDSSHSMDQQSSKEANGLVKSVQSMKRTNTNSSLSLSTDANGHHTSSSRHSDPRMVGRQMNRTLPGLIAEIMSEGKRMSYEELCNAVLPHWPHLRKHNGERYAYSSHSQAVLDCLRNRSEWARLVDRGPKTSASRKRRKLDTDSMSIDSEDDEDQMGKNLKGSGSKSFDSQQEDFPKGKRKARKRRRLALQGRGIVRRRRRADVVSDDESESFSYSSEGSMSSEEEIQGGGTSVAGSEVSSSSDEAR